MSAATLAVLLLAVNVWTRLSYRRMAPRLVLGIQAMRKLAGQAITYRPRRPGESLPGDAAPRFDAAQRELTAAGFTVLGDLMEVGPEGDAGISRWFSDAGWTICGWFGVVRNKPVMMLFSEAEGDTFFLTGRGATSTATAQPPTNHREFLAWDVGLPETVARHNAQIAQTRLAAIVQPATLDGATALVSRLRDSTARWRQAQPYHELLERDVRAIVGNKWKYLGPTLVRLLGAFAALVTRVTVVSTLVASIGVVPGGAQQSALTDAERGGLLFANTALRHPSFGFVIPLPGPRFAPDTGMQNAVREMLGERQDLFAWSFHVPSDSFFSISVIVYKGFDGTQGGFRRFFTEIMPSGRAEDEPVYRDSIYWEAQRREYRLFSEDTRGVTTNERCIPSPPSRRPGVIVCALLVGGDPNQIQIVRDGLRFTTAP